MSPSRKITHLVAVGACAIDTILTVPYWPAEDSKLRATSLIRRRGGNTPNTLEVLQQLTEAGTRNGADHTRSNAGSLLPTTVELSLIATLPSRTSPHTAFIASSFEQNNNLVTPKDEKHDATSSPPPSPPCKVSLDHVIYRENHSDPISSYIISTPSTSSRTIINHNPLLEMTFSEFRERVDDLLLTRSSSSTPGVEQRWHFHFEGRIPPTTLQCLQYLRHLQSTVPSRLPHLRISVELEKPHRPGLRALAQEADVIFFSRSWAEGEGYGSAEECLRGEVAALCAADGGGKMEREGVKVRARMMVCTWGKDGAWATRVASSSSSSQTMVGGEMTRKEIDVIHSPAFVDPTRAVLDTTGAGDTFIAGILYGFLSHDDDDDDDDDEEEEEQRQGMMSLKTMLDSANRLAGEKVLQEGFGGLGRARFEAEKG